MSRHFPIFTLMSAVALLGACASNRPAQEATPTTPSSAAAASPHRMMRHGNMMGAGGAGMMNGAMMADLCPMTVPGTTVAASDTEGGVALTFSTTQAAQLSELRSRVKHMAEMHDRGGMMGGGMMGGGMMGNGTAGSGPTGGGMMGGGMMGGGMMGGSPMHSASVTAVEVEGGIQLVFRPKSADQLEALRQHVKEHAERLQHGSCPMMTAQSGAAASDAK